MVDASADELEFEAPGPGEWHLDRSHFTGGTTPIMQWLMADAMETAFRKNWGHIGIPAETMSARFVHGFAYTRLRPLIAPDRPTSRPPPLPVLKLAARLHPEFRRRTKAAERTLAESPAPPVIAEWRTRTRPRLVATNLAFQSVDLGGLDDDVLAGHLDALLDHLRWTYEEHFRLHSYDLGPIARLLHWSKQRRIASADMLAALVGASPSTAEPFEALARIRALVADAGVEPASLDDVRAASPEAAGALDDYLRTRSAMLYAGYDIDGPTLGEAPHVILATIVNQSANRPVDAAAHTSVAEGIREGLSPDDRPEFDRLLSEAREAMDMRDDNGPITAEWPAGLLRLAMLEAGRRLTRSGRISRQEHVFELDREEIIAIVASGAGPSRREIGERARRRAEQKLADPPPLLGDPEPEAPLDALPPALATTVEMVQVAIAELGMAEPAGSGSGAAHTDLEGVGIGQDKLVGTACVALDAEEAFEVLEPGQILVTRTTSPAYNMVLTMVGGLVTAEGGPMCHAAVLSRELNIPAVIGARGALGAIETGDLIEVDPAAGTVTVLERP